MPRPVLHVAPVLLLSLVLAAATATAKDVPSPSAANNADEAGFESLFNGRDLDGWQGATKSYKVENGLLVSQPRGGGFLYTKGEYGDFILRLEYKLTPGANNGVGIRTPAGGRATLDGLEIQILDDTAKKWAQLEPSQYNGSIYGVVPAKRGHLKPLGQWNAMEIRARGHQIRVTVNGTVVAEADLSKVGPKKIHRREAEGLQNLRGHLCLCAHRTRVEFRKLRIKEL